MKFNKNEFGWKEKVSVNTDELVTKNDIPHYNETLITEISGEDFGYFMNNDYFNMSALNIDETKSYIGKIKFNIDSDEEYNYKFVYNKEADVLMDEMNSAYIYNHKSYDGENFIEDENSAVLTLGITTFGLIFDGYFRLYEIDKLELDGNCLPDDLSIPNSLTVGTRTGDIGIYSVAEGDGLTASGYCSHAEGGNTTASGDFSHAEGFLTEAIGNCSHAEGKSTTASKNASHAEGYYTKASSSNQHVQGKYNIEDGTGTYAHIVGNGTSDNARSNAHTLDWQGNGWYKGKLSQDGTPTEDKDLTTKKYVDDNIDTEIRELDLTNQSIQALAKESAYDYVSILNTTSISNANYKSGDVGEAIRRSFNITVSTNDLFNNLYKERIMITIYSEGKRISRIYEIRDKTVFNTITFIPNLISKPLGENSAVFQIKYSGNQSFNDVGVLIDDEGKIAVGITLSKSFSTEENISALDKATIQVDRLIPKFIESKHFKETPTEDMDVATKKYVDDSIASQPQISFDTEGNLVVTISGVTKKFKEITE